MKCLPVFLLFITFGEIKYYCKSKYQISHCSCFRWTLQSAQSVISFEACRCCIPWHTASMESYGRFKYSLMCFNGAKLTLIGQQALSTSFWSWTHSFSRSQGVYHQVNLITKKTLHLLDSVLFNFLAQTQGAEPYIQLLIIEMLMAMTDISNLNISMPVRQSAQSCRSGQ